MQRHAARLAAAHGLTEGQKTKNEPPRTGPIIKTIVLVEERERQVLAGVPTSHRESLEKLIQEYHDLFFRRNCRRAYLQNGRYNITLM